MFDLAFSSQKPPELGRFFVEVKGLCQTELLYKTIRSWARAYGEGLKPGDIYSAQSPVICVSFANGSLDSGEYKKIHKCCKIMDVDDQTIFSDALELHYIDMKAFVKMINESDTKDKTLDSVLAKWLAVITEKDIEDKSIIKNICNEKGAIGMAVSALAKLSEDSITRQAYQKRQDEIMLQNMKIEKYKRIAEQETLRANQAESALNEKDAIIAKLRSQLIKN